MLTTLIFDHLITFVTKLTNTVISHSISNLYILHDTKSVILPYYSHHGWILDQSTNNQSASQTHNYFLHTTFDSDTWSVDAILAYNKYHKQFLIKWSGYPNSQNSWVNSTALDSQIIHKFIKLHNPKAPMTFKHPFTTPYPQAYANSQLPYLYSNQFPIVMHAKYLGIYLNSYAHYCSFDFFTTLSKNTTKINMFTAKFHNTFGTIGPHFWRTLNHAFFTFIYSQIDWNLHVFPYHKFYFPEIDKLLRTSQRAFLDINRFHLSNKAHDCFTGYVPLHERWLYLFTTFLIKLIKRNNCALSKLIRSFVLEESSPFPFYLPIGLP